MNPTPAVHDPSVPEIRHVAYRLWPRRGESAGRGLEIGLAARENLKHRRALPANPHLASPAQTRTRNAQAIVRKRR